MSRSRRMLVRLLRPAPEFVSRADLTWRVFLSMGGYLLWALLLNRALAGNGTLWKTAAWTAAFLLWHVSASKRRFVVTPSQIRVCALPMYGISHWPRWLLYSLPLAAASAVLSWVFFGRACAMPSAAVGMARESLVPAGSTIGGSVVLLVLTTLTYPLLEEFYFRGRLLHPLIPLVGRPGAIMGTSLVFGLIHGHPQLLIAHVLAGFVFASAVIGTGSIWAAVGLHFVENLTLTVKGSAEANAINERLASSILYRCDISFLMLVAVLGLLVYLSWNWAALTKKWDGRRAGAT